MTVEKLRKATLAQPFIPFTVVMGDGTRYKVQHPENIAMAPKAERTFVVFTGHGEEHAVLDLLLVTALEFGGVRSARANGTTRGQRH